MKYAMLILLAAVLTAGCHSQNTIVTAGGNSPGIIIKDSPDDSQLYVDGVHIGEAEDFDGGRKYLALDPGVHTIVVRTEEGRILIEKKIFLEGEVKTIEMASYKD